VARRVDETRILSGEVMTLLKVLREIDGIVDLARGEVQLLVLLSAKDGMVRPSVLADSLGLRSKTVIDAVQKLKRKGLLKKLGRDRYKLTDKGRRLKRLIFSLPRASAMLGSQEAVYQAYMISEAVLILGTVAESWYPLSRLARHVGVSAGKLHEIVEQCDLFKVREAPHGIEVALSFDGRRLYEELLRRRGLGPTVAKVLSMLTFTPDPRKALSRFFILYLAVSALVVFEILASGLTGVGELGVLYRLLPSVMAAVTWLAVSIYLAILMLSRK